MFGEKKSTPVAIYFSTYIVQVLDNGPPFEALKSSWQL